MDYTYSEAEKQAAIIVDRLMPVIEQGGSDLFKRLTLELTELIQ